MKIYYLASILIFSIVAAISEQSCKQRIDEVKLINIPTLQIRLKEQNFKLSSNYINYIEGGIGGDAGTEHYGLRRRPVHLIQELVVSEGSTEYRVILDSRNAITIKPPCPKLLLLVEQSRM